MKGILATATLLVLAMLNSGIGASPEVVPEAIHRIGWTLVHSTWQLIAIALIASLVDAFARQRSANVRYVCATAALAVMSAAPVITWTLIDVASIRTARVSPTPRLIVDGETTPVVDSSDLAVSPAPPVTSSLEHQAPKNLPPKTEPRDIAADRGHIMNGVLTPHGTRDQGMTVTDHSLWSGFAKDAGLFIESRLPVFVAIWLAGVFACSLRPIWGLWTQWRLCRTGNRPVSDECQRLLEDLARRMHLARAVRIAESAAVALPMVVGYLRPVILLPASVLTGLTTAQMESLLAHELAHVRRHDWLVNALQVVVETLLFYHPAVWWLSRRIRNERELCCDDLALTIVRDSATYGRMLLALEEMRHTALPQPAVSATGGDLVHRIRRLLPTRRPLEQPSRSWFPGLITLAILGGTCAAWYGARVTADHGPPIADQARPDNSAVASADRREDPHGQGATGQSADDSPAHPLEQSERGEMQVLTWTMLIDSVLAESVTRLGEELPEQGAYRVAQVDAARLRETLFDAKARSHIFSDLNALRMLEAATDANSSRSLFESPNFFFSQIRYRGLLTPVAHGTHSGQYSLFPGRRFDLQLDRVQLEITEYGGINSPVYKINQALSYQGPLAIGTSVVFVGKLASETGKTDYHEIIAYEAIPKATEFAQRLLADLAWFKAGRAEEAATLKRAEKFNAESRKLPVKLPERWTRPLPHGGSVSLVAIARPKTHPFCWWDADGTPRSTDWSLQTHALGRPDLLALVCIRDPHATDRLRQGVTYVRTEQSSPLPLYRSWEELDDSELYLFPICNSDDQRPMVGVNTGTGPWKELGPLTPKQGITYGQADYLLGESRREPDAAVYRILGHRYLPEEAIQLRIIDIRGQSRPLPLNIMQSAVSSHQGVPPEWDGWRDYQSQLKEQEVDHIVVDSRPRHWVNFTGFATELSVDNFNPSPLSVAPPAALAPLPNRLAAEFDQILKKDFGFLNDDDRAAVVEDFRRFAERQPESVSDARAAALVAGLRGVVLNDLNYLTFFSSYRSLKWRLSMAMHPRSLTADEQRRRDQQRDDIRKQIRDLPLKDFHIARTHGHAIDRLQARFDDPWRGWFHEPMSEAELVQFQRDRKNWRIEDPVFAPSSFDSLVMNVKSASLPTDDSLGTSVLSLDADRIATLKPGLLRFIARFPDQAQFFGQRDLVYDQAPESGRRVLDFGRRNLEVPASVPQDAKAVQLWAATSKSGLLAYDGASHSLFLLRGAKIGILSVETWQDADRLTDDELLRIVAAQELVTIKLAEHFGPRPTSSGYGPRPPGSLLAVVSAAGELGVVQVESISQNGITAHLRQRPVTFLRP